MLVFCTKLFIKGNMILMVIKKAVGMFSSAKIQLNLLLLSSILYLESILTLKYSLLMLKKLLRFHTGEMLVSLKITRLSIRDRL